jgi:drug/metabolite transporter (DMT)-like permease
VQDLGRLVGWMAGALLCFSAMAIAVRELAAAGLSVSEILAARCLGGLLLLGAWAALGGGGGGLRAIGRPAPLRLHLLRNTLHVGAQLGWATGLTLLPLATVFALEFTAPAWTTLLAVLVLGERATAARIGSLLLGFLGVLVVLRPGAEAFQPAALIVLASAIGFAAALVVTKHMTGILGVMNILFWMQVIQLPMLLGLHLAATGGAAPLRGLGMGHAPMVALLCVSGLVAQVSVANAFRYGDAATVIPLDFLRIPLIAAVGALLYGERFDLFVLLGAAITAAGIVWNLRDAAAARGPTRSARRR